MEKRQITSDSDSSDGSVSYWLSRLPEGDQQAQLKIWERYAPEIERSAKKYLQGVERRSSDEEDIVVQVLNSLYVGMQNGQFSTVENRRHLRALLIGMARKKSAEAARNKNALKRGGGKVRTDVGGTDSGDLPGIDEVPSNFPDPSRIVEQAQTLTNTLEMLGCDLLRQILLLKIASFSNLEIAERTGSSERTVERRLRKIRAKLDDN